MQTTFTSYTRRWWALVTVSISQLMVALDATVINIALPRAQISLGFSYANRQLDSWALPWRRRSVA